MIWVIAGATASGKTRLAIELAQRLDAEIVSADSQQVYRFFDIGTAKPSAIEQRAVRHHLISCVDPLETFSGAQFQRRADEAIKDIERRGKAVVVVGGTGLYLRMLLRGVVEAPPADPALRAELEQLSNEALRTRLMACDPASANRLALADRVRMIRAVEIHAHTGQPASVLRAEHAFREARYAASFKVLNPPRDELYRTIDARTEKMFAQGLVEETRALVARGFRDAAPMRAVGYAQALAHLEGQLSLADAIAQVAMKTRHYAKRQLTWFRREPGAEWVAPPYQLDAWLRAEASGA